MTDGNLDLSSLMKEISKEENLTKEQAQFYRYYFEIIQYRQ